jgi:tRNA(fMet)-specific endonuclease VapC
MHKFLLDTGILLGYLRGAGYAAYVDKIYSPFDPSNITFTSIVTLGEIRSLALQLSWGEARQKRLEEILKIVPVVDINHDEIIGRYAEIDAFSLNKLSMKKLPKGASARQMSKNDLWISSTASVLKTPLITIDKDFDHLHGIFLDVIFIDQHLAEKDA